MIKNLQKRVFGVTREELPDSVCISCKTKLNIELFSEIDRKEFRISGLCPQCFDDITREEI